MKLSPVPFSASPCQVYYLTFRSKHSPQHVILSTLNLQMSHDVILLIWHSNFLTPQRWNRCQVINTQRSCICISHWHTSVQFYCNITLCCLGVFLQIVVSRCKLQNLFHWTYKSTSKPNRYWIVPKDVLQLVCTNCLLNSEQVCIGIPDVPILAGQYRFWELCSVSHLDIWRDTHLCRFS
jgi:hypothetical protein